MPPRERLYADPDEELSLTDFEDDDDRAQERGRTRFILFAVAIGIAATALVLSLGRLVLTRQGTGLDHAPGQPVTAREAPPVVPEPPAAPTGAASAPPVPAAPPTPSPPPPEPAAPTTRESPEPTLPPSSRGPSASAAEGTGTAEAPATPSASSEERMAAFLVQELGPASAEARALQNADWYDSTQSEHTYWERVAELIKRRERR